MSNAAFVLIAVAVIVVVSVLLWLLNRKPQTFMSSIDDFEREMKALGRENPSERSSHRGRGRSSSAGQGGQSGQSGQAGQGGQGGLGGQAGPARLSSDPSSGEHVSRVQARPAPRPTSDATSAPAGTTESDDGGADQPTVAGRPGDEEPRP